MTEWWSDLVVVMMGLMVCGGVEWMVCHSDHKYCFKLKLYGPFLWMGSTASRLEPLQGGSLPFTTKFPEIPGTHFIDLQRLLLVICQFYESEWWGICDCERIYLCPCFEEVGKDQESVSPHETPLLTGPLTQPKLVGWLGRVLGAEDDGQVVGRIGCGGRESGGVRGVG